MRQVLSDEGIGQIHETSMRLLEKVGVNFPCQEALEVFRRHGMATDGARVFVPEERVAAALKSVPRQFTIHGRNPERNVVVGGGEPAFAPGYGAPFLVDPDVGRRAATLDDYHNLARLAHALPNQDLSGHLMVEPGGVAAHSAHLCMLQANMVHSDKPFIGSTDGTVGAQDTMEMAGILFGGEPDRPVTIGLINSLSPLGYSDKMLEALLVYTRHRQPVIIAAMALAGSTAPITLAGLLAQQNAELLAGISLAQLVSPGTPVVYGCTSTNLHMKTGALTIGGPELSMLVAAHAQLARHYGLPCRSGGALTDASLPDVQAGYESMLGLLTAVTNGVDFILHAAGILSSYLAFSYEKFVLDDEMCGMVRRLHHGIAVDGETLAYDVIAGVARSGAGNYLTEPQTVKRCRREFWQPAVSDRAGLEAWMAGGREPSPAAAAARRRWEKLVAEHEDPAIDGSIAGRLQEYVERNV